MLENLLGDIKLGGIFAEPIEIGGIFGEIIAKIKPLFEKIISMLFGNIGA